MDLIAYEKGSSVLSCGRLRFRKIVVPSLGLRELCLMISVAVVADRWDRGRENYRRWRDAHQSNLDTTSKSPVDTV